MPADQFMEVVRASEAMEQIESTLFLRKQEAFHERWLIQLRGLFPVQVNKDLLATLELG